MSHSTENANLSIHIWQQKEFRRTSRFGDFDREGLGRSHAGAMNQMEFRENCLCNIHSACIVCIGFSRKAALAAHWGRGVDLVLFPGESAKTKLILKRYARGIIYNLYIVTDGSFTWIAFNSVASLSLTVCAVVMYCKKPVVLSDHFCQVSCYIVGKGRKLPCIESKNDKHEQNIGKLTS